MNKLLPILLIALFSVFYSPAEAQGLPAVPKEPVLSCFPNPATAFITFSFDKNYEKGYSIHIYNFLGKKMHEVPNVSTLTKIDLERFNKGLYIYQLLDKNGKVLKSGKFQVTSF